MINDLINVDKDFNEKEFYGYVNNIFVKLYTGVMLQDINNIKHFLSDNVFDNYQDKINILKEKQQREMFDELNVASSYIVNVNVEEDRFIITVKLTSKYLHYIINLENNEIISGNKDVREIHSYMLTFTKTKTASNQGIVKQCPKCGNSLNVNHSGICQFCHQSYNLKDHDYILNNINEI